MNTEKAPEAAQRQMSVPARFLQAVTVLVGAGALAFLLVQPHFEGRNAHATVFEIYFKDPFLAYAYVGSFPFFMALVQIFKALGYVAKDEAFSPVAAITLRRIRNYALAFIGFIAVGELILVLGPNDDHAGPVALGVLISGGSLVAAAAAAMFERIIKNTRTTHD